MGCAVQKCKSSITHTLKVDVSISTDTLFKNLKSTKASYSRECQIPYLEYTLCNIDYNKITNKVEYYRYFIYRDLQLVTKKETKDKHSLLDNLGMLIL